jgi:hypothetical protein
MLEASGDMNNEQLVKFAEAFASNGIVCLRFTCTAPMTTRVKAFRACLELLDPKKGKYPVSKVILSGRSMGSRYDNFPSRSEIQRHHCEFLA